MPFFTNALKNTILGIARFGTTTLNPTTQAAITPTIRSGNITTGLLINPIYTPSSGTFYGEQINPQYNPQLGNFTSAYGIHIAPTITPTGSGAVTNAYGLSITGPAANLGSIDNAFSLYIENSLCSETIVNKYTAVFGTDSSTLVGIGTTTPVYNLDIAGILSAHRVYHAGTMMNNQLIGLAQGADQGGFGGGSVGANKQICANTTAYFDTTLVGGGGLYCGAVFDGRYLYLIPLGSESNLTSSTITRYDTTQSFSGVGSYTSFNLLNVSSNSLGYRGAVFDGRYIYLVPQTTTFATRYDTVQNFNLAGSYTTFDVNQIGNSSTFYGGVFDGRYVYFFPYTSVTMTRYDTTLSFTATNSYTAFSLAPIMPQQTFGSGVFDGRYVYLVPVSVPGTILRYDTTLSFTSQGSFTCFDLSLISVFTSYLGGVFDGRYIYLVPIAYGTVTRYDTQQNFNLPGSYTVFDVNPVLGLANKRASFAGGTFDGRYVYFAPWTSGRVLAFDTTKTFNSISSYTMYDAQSIAGRQFIGATFDGRYVYFIPNESPTIIRMDAYTGPQATVRAASRAPNGFVVGSNAGIAQPPANGMLVGDTIAINAADPQGFNVYVNGIIHANAVIATNLTITPDNTSGGIYATGGTTRNQLITLAQGYDQGGLGGGSVGTNKTMSLNTTSFYDLTQGGTQSVAGFCGGVFDGRYIYYVPYINHGLNGTVVRYDTTSSFAAAGSYAVYDLRQINSLAEGFWGGLYDGRYVYFTPFGGDTVFTRYDTTYSFTASAGYSVIDLSTIGVTPTRFAGGAFDGRYIYLSPGAPSSSLINVTIVRYDTTLSFIATTSYSTFNTAVIDAAGVQYFGAIFDGRYIYFSPWRDSTSGNSGSIARYDTTLPFSQAGSYALFNLTEVATSCLGYQGGVFDGRYVYYIPNTIPGTFINPPTFVRYDTMLSFAAVGSYTTFSLLLIDPSNLGQQAGAAFDGRYIYFGQDQVSLGIATGTIIRYDITRPFNLTSSYTCFCINQNVTFKGPVYDGRYVYFPPADMVGGVSSGTIVRIDAYPGPQANAIAASQAPNGFVVGTYAGTTAAPVGSLIVGGRIGVDTLFPQYNVDIVGTMNAKNIIAPNLNLTQLYASGGTSNNQNVALSQGYTQGGFGGGSVGTNKTMSAATTQYFDTTLSAGTVVQYSGGVFDGRYIYLSPLGDPGLSSDKSSSVTRYDTTLPFSDTRSYTTFNMLLVSSNSRGFRGAVFDGRYVYFIAFGTTWTARYDTFQNFNLASSYAIFDMALVGGAHRFNGGLFDGRYVYCCPYFSVTMTRYDTSLPFDSSSSYAAISLLSYDTNFAGGTYDGRYIYLAPISKNSIVVRYDTTLSFTDFDSFTGFDLTTIPGIVGTAATFGAVFDGRYVYFVPHNQVGVTMTRYDTRQDFHSVDSYRVFDLRRVASSDNYSGGIFDGRYVVFAPYAPNDAVVKYDTTQSFDSPGSYSVFTLITSTSQFNGAIFDGRYFYFVPRYGQNLTRLDAYPGPQATALAANQAPNGFMIGSYAGAGLVNNTANSNAMVVSGNVGMCKATPQFLLDVNGTTDATAWSIASTLYGSTGLLTNNEYAALSQGYNEGGFGSGSVGTNKPLIAAVATVFDMTTVDSNSVGFMGALFDGRYTYLVPGAGGPIAQLDTSQVFNSADSYKMFYPTSMDTSASGFAGGLFDGRYIYFIPLQNRKIFRYDTEQPFNTACSYFNATNSYAIFDLATVDPAVPGYAGGAFDGRYLYFASNGDSGMITRYDTILPFAAASSYTCFDTKGISAGAAGYFGAAYDGRYVYFVPGSGSAGTVSRYDTSLSFNAIGSWTLFDLTQLQSGCRGYYGAVFDSRYIYFAPYANTDGIFGTIVRYDTTQSFVATGSYTLFDTARISAGCKGFAGAVFDGRYVYFSPAAASGTVVRFDTTLTFTLISSYTTLDLSELGVCKGYVGCIFDGQYVYFAPNQQGLLARVDAYSGPQATAIAAGQAPNGFAVGTYAGAGLSNSAPSGGLSYHNSLIVSGNVGIGLTTPTFTLQLALDSAFKPTTNFWANNSDVRIKQNIEDVSDALTTICQLRPRKFTYHPDYAKDILADPKETRYGFIADEVENILEGCVSASSMHCYGGKMREWFDRGAMGEMPQPLSDLTNLKTFNMQNILIYYIQAIKELSEIQDKLQKELTECKRI